ncbi:hypothetical protein J6590_081701 [Homalodisca vitripennis]|nr:hypothetical protein J6590_081701 [Homalodisca vitripennis]
MRFNELRSSIESMRSSVWGSQRTLENYMARENVLGNDLKSSISRLNYRLSGLESRMDITNNNLNALNNRLGNLQNQVNQQAEVSCEKQQ